MHDKVARFDNGLETLLQAILSLCRPFGSLFADILVRVVAMSVPVACFEMPCAGVADGQAASF